MTDNDAIDLGAAMWLSVAQDFYTAMVNEGAVEIGDQSLVFAGFISSMSGCMLKMLGPELCQHILEQAKQNCTHAMRAQLRVVPK